MPYGTGRKYIIIACVLWTFVIGGFFTWHMSRAKEDLMQLARLTALTSYQKDLAYHVWSSQQGGVYIPAETETLHDQYPDHFPERNVITTSGRHLTLIVPAELSRRVQELAAARFDLHAHLTSLKPMREKNAPDEWEVKTLRAFENGVEEVSSLEKIDGQEFFRLMRPFMISAACLECHTEQGYKVGDVGGGLSVSLAMAPLRTVMGHHLTTTALG